jgi:hypothetical protein
MSDRQARARQNQGQRGGRPTDGVYGPWRQAAGGDHGPRRRRR